MDCTQTGVAIVLWDRTVYTEQERRAKQTLSRRWRKLSRLFQQNKLSRFVKYLKPDLLWDSNLRVLNLMCDVANSGLSSLTFSPFVLT